MNKKTYALINEYKIAESLNHTEKSGYILCSLGQEFFINSNFKLALEYYTKSINIFKKTDSNVGLANVYTYLCELFFILGKPEIGIELNHKASILNDNIVAKEDDTNYFARMLVNTGYSMYNQCDSELSLKYYFGAVEFLQLRKSQNSIDNANVLEKIGLVYLKLLYDYEKALDYFFQAKEIYTELSNSQRVLFTILKICDVYIMGKKPNFSEATKLITLCIKQFNNNNNNYGLYESYLLIGNLNHRINPTSALEYYNKALNYLIIQRKYLPYNYRNSFYWDKGVIRNQILKYSIFQKSPLTFFNNIEKIKSSSFLESISSDRYKSEDKKNIFNKFQDSIFPNQKTVPLNKIWDTLTPNQNIIYFIQNDENHYFVVLITNSNFEIENIEIDLNLYYEKFQSIFESDLNLEEEISFSKIIELYNRLILQSSKMWSLYKNKFQNLSKLLYNDLIKPYELEILDKKTLIIIPDGDLALLPFDTLINNSGQYLIENYDIKNVNSCSIWYELKKRNYNKTKRNSILAVGNARYDSEIEAISNNDNLWSTSHWDIDNDIKRKTSLQNYYLESGLLGNPPKPFKSLKGSLMEIKKISKIYRDATILVEENASEIKLNELNLNNSLKTFKIIHFATHAISSADYPNLSAIVLSQGKAISNSDGFLNYTEIENLHLNSDLVTLSACETGRGRNYEGEGLQNFVNAFFIAGSKGVIVTLWKILDSSTAEFMSTFYKITKEENKSFSEALSETKRRFLNGSINWQWESPFYWSAFVYYGA